MKLPRIRILSIGDELLYGQTVNTNLSWLGEQLTRAGFEVGTALTIRDDRLAILQAVSDSHSYDVVISTGGLGPTADDITKDVLCEILGDALVMHEPTLINIERIFASRGFRMTDRNRRQAMVPASADILLNLEGTAPGISFLIGDTRYFFLPGVPFEMKHLFTEKVLPILNKELKPGHIIQRTVLTCGVGESFLSDTLKEWESSLPEQVSLAYLPSPGIVKLRLTAQGLEADLLHTMLEKEVRALRVLIPDVIFGEGDESMGSVVGNLLIRKGLSLAIAESCTGGKASSMITSVAGSSAYFKGSVIAYSNQVKIDVLGVEQQEILEYGVVSEQVVCQMAEGVRKALHSDFGIASSGIAGPGGGSDDKPVGLTCLAVAGPRGTVSMKFRFGQHRGRNIQRASLALLDMLRKELVKL